jgi:hypothetical protein
MDVTTLKAHVRARDGLRCTKCGVTNDEHLARTGGSLHVHRLQPGSAYTAEGCVTLCCHCHGPEPKSPRGTRRNARGQRNLNVWIDDHLDAAFEEAVEAVRPRTHKTALLEVILEEYLAGKGLWPPKKGGA